MVHRSSARS
jgi:hypothetical protein